MVEACTFQCRCSLSVVEVSKYIVVFEKHPLALKRTKSLLESQDRLLILTVATAGVMKILMLCRSDDIGGNGRSVSSRVNSLCESAMLIRLDGHRTLL